MSEMMNEESKKIIDRNLGDEWSGWAGDLTHYEKEIKEGRALFIIIYLASLTVFTGLTLFAYYMISLRLSAWNPALETGIKYLLTASFIVFYIWSGLLLLTVGSGRNFLFFMSKGALHLEWLFPLVYWVASVFKVSKDRVMHSFLRVNNALVYAAGRNLKSKSLLVLLPRCLSRETREMTTALAQQYGVTIFTATGGSSARQMVKSCHPDAIIGVACERDLVAGISDVSKKITVIGIANIRPEGPCKNTSIDLKEFEEAIKFLLKI